MLSFYYNTGEPKEAEQKDLGVQKSADLTCSHQCVGLRFQ